MKTPDSPPGGPSMGGIRLAVLALALIAAVAGFASPVHQGPVPGVAAASTTADPVARCDLSTSEIEPGESVTLDASASENATAYRWDKTGDGEFGPLTDNATRTFTYEQEGTYEPQVRVMAPDESTDTATCGTLTVESANSPPSANFSYFPTDPAPDEQVTFTAGATDKDGDVVAYAWTVDGDPVGESPDLAYTFGASGEYVVELTVRDDDGATDTASETILVASENDPPSVAMSYSPEEPAVDEQMTFTVDATDPDGDVVEYAWTVDGEPIVSSPDAEFGYVFEELGEHEVEVTVTDDEGATATDVTAVTVQREETAAKPTDTPSGEVHLESAWWHTPSDPRAGQVVTLVASGPVDPRITYRWDPDADGSFEMEGPIVTVAFGEPGDHRVTLEAVGPEGAVEASAATISVGDAATPADDGELSVWMSPLDPAPGQTVTLFADPAGSPDAVETYRWDLDDDGEFDVRGQSVTFALPDDGTAGVTVETVGEDGRTDSVSTSVSVSGESRVPDRSGPDIWMSPLDPEPGQTVVLVADPVAPQSEIETYRWDLDDDGEFNATGQAVTYANPQAGRFPVTLTVERINGTSASVEELVAIGNTSADDAWDPDRTTEDGNGGPSLRILMGLGALLLVVITLVGLLVYRRDAE